MGFLKTRLIAEKNRRPENSPFRNVLSLLGLKKEESSEELFLKDRIEFFTDLDEQKEIQQMIDSYESDNYSEFYQEYQSVLPLPSVWGLEEFIERSQRGSLLDLLIVWFLFSLDVLYCLEWNKKVRKTELISFVNQRVVEFYNEDFKLNTFNENTEDESELDLLCFLEKLDHDLTSYGYRLVYFGISGEEYFIGVFDKKTADALVGKSFGIVTLYPCSG